MTVALPDVNVLVALAWPSHVHHRQARAWFRQEAEQGWATCPLTQAGFVRVSSNPRAIPEAVTPGQALGLLRQMVAHPRHVFWPDGIPLLDAAVPTTYWVGHRQVTDAYLVGLAWSQHGRLVTFDHGLEALLPARDPRRQALCVLRAED